MTLEAGDRPNEVGRRDPSSEEFPTFISEAALQELGPTNCRYTWQSSARPHNQSCFDCVLSLLDILEQFPQANV